MWKHIRSVCLTVVLVMLFIAVPTKTVWADDVPAVSGNDIATKQEGIEESEEEETEQEESSEAQEPEVSEETMPDLAISLFSAELSYTDANGNDFTYEVDENENATITGITVSGRVLIIPETIDGYPVIAVENGTSRAVRNPGTRIPELTVNCPMVGVNAFAGCNIGILTIGEDVSCFPCYSSNDWTHSWQQFYGSEIDSVVYNATEIPIAIPVETSLSVTVYGPFYQAKIKDSVVFGDNVRLVPEYLFRAAIMDIAEVAINAERIGSNAFAGAGISIGVLTLGEDVRFLEQCSDHMAIEYMWCTFQAATIGTLQLNSTNLQLGHSKDAAAGAHIYGPFYQATVGELKVGSGVTRIPELFLYTAKLSQDELTLGAATIEAYAFGGTGIHIGKLTLESTVEVFEESFFSTASDHYYFQFRNADIDIYCYRVPELTMGHAMGTGLTNTVYGPFYGATVRGLEIDENVEVIPEYFLNQATAALGNMTINTPKIGAHAFGGGNISFDTLTIGEDVTEYFESYYSTTIKHFWYQFQSCTINHLVYLPGAAVTTHESTDMASTTSDIYAPFAGTKIQKLTLADDIQRLADYLFYNATISEDELELNISVIGAYAFAGANIHIGTLIIGEDVTTFSFAPDSTTAYYIWKQFTSATVDELRYEARAAITEGFAGDDHYYYGPFYGCKVGHFTLGDSLQKIPAYCFSGMVLNQTELEIDVPLIEPGAFSGANLQIGTLTLGEKVERFTYTGNTLIYFKQFYQTKIGKLNLLSPSITTIVSSCYKGPFEESTIHGFEVGEQVEVIPDYLFQNAKMTLSELNLQNVKLGYRTFYSANNMFAVLNVGENVTYAGLGKYTGTPGYSMNCFEKAKITTLNYNGSGTKAVWTTTTSVSGMFAGAVITQLNIGEDAEQIPAGWFRNATMDQSELTIPCGWGPYAFYGSSIKLGRVNLIGDFTELSYISSYEYGFYNSTIGTLYYDLPNLQASVAGNYTTEPFTNAKITNLIVGEDVQYLDDAIFKNCKFTGCQVEAVHASDSYKSQTLAASYLPMAMNLTIHYNSDFKPYFSQRATNSEWECINHMDEVSREKVYNVETQQYELEVLNRCKVCGYEVRTAEELDETHEIYLSLPVSVDLTFDSDTKQYSGMPEIYAYGRLGNAYSGITVSVDPDGEGYGIAVKSGAQPEEYDICGYFRILLGDSVSQVFSPEELAQNKLALDNGETQIPFRESLMISVDGLAFLEGGPGEYRIGIPIKLEFTH